MIPIGLVFTEEIAKAVLLYVLWPGPGRYKVREVLSVVAKARVYSKEVSSR